MACEQVTLQDVCELIVDCPHTSAKDEGVGYPLIRTPNVGRGRLILTDVHRVSQDVYERRVSRAVPRQGDLILAREAPAGNVAIVSPGIEVCLGQRTMLLRPDSSFVVPEYLNYYLNAPEQRDRMLRLANGATVSHINVADIRNMPVQLPSRGEQSKVAELLNVLDDKIDLNNRLNDYLEQLCQSLFNRFDNDENNPFVKVSDIADVNPRRTLKKGEEALCIEMADLSTTGAFPTDWRTKAYNGGVKFVNGDTILARITPCLENGKAGYINFLEQDEVAFGSTEYIVLTSKGELPSEFFYFLARNEDFISYATAHMNGSSGRQRVSGSDVGNYEVRMPSEKQISEFRKIAGNAMRVISASSIESRKLAQLRDALLPKLMSGEIDASKVELTQLTNNHLADY
ncbi:type I restriction-modification system subunit S [Bifidobacteriaceae bacterium MCC02037]|nr:type I restriction-modification system subunit S [Bifidobacteriaceae bacterium MCC02037]GDZ68861.1 type I restriction-modification system subunit S [Bifidobacteriaceae bacterium MCC01988]